MEKRLLLAAVLSLGVLFLWEAFAAKNAPRPPAAGRPTAAASTTSSSSTAAPAGASSETNASSIPGAGGRTPASFSSAAAVAPVSATAEQTTVLANDLVRATFSNRGGVLVSYVLLQHTDEQKKPLELVRQLAPPAPRPLALDFPTRPDLTERVAQALFAAEPVAPKAVRFRFADGTISVTKEIRLGDGYLFDVQTDVQGAPAYTLLVGTGLRNASGDEQVSRICAPGFRAGHERRRFRAGPARKDREAPGVAPRRKRLRRPRGQLLPRGSSSETGRDSRRPSGGAEGCREQAHAVDHGGSHRVRRARHPRLFRTQGRGSAREHAPRARAHRRLRLVWNPRPPPSLALEAHVHPCSQLRARDPPRHARRSAFCSSRSCTRATRP